MAADLVFLLCLPQARFPSDRLYYTSYAAEKTGLFSIIGLVLRQFLWYVTKENGNRASYCFADAGAGGEIGGTAKGQERKDESI
ncbi:MAG: hypothetical protein LUG93_11310 [Lachnospiraceae bacterium]|nr:hypothetical protein [Lachnospiraceae bacterium]